MTYHVEDRKIIGRQAGAGSLLPPSGLLGTELRSSGLVTGALTRPSLYLNKAISCQISLTTVSVAVWGIIDAVAFGGPPPRACHVFLNSYDLDCWIC